MYTLYYLPDACSLATHVVLNELNQPVEIIDIQKVDDFKIINPVGTVPVLLDSSGMDGGNITRLEGAAVLLHLLDKYENTMLARTGETREQAIQNIMFANATMHPAYSVLFFIAKNITVEEAKKSAFASAEININRLWQIIDQQLAGRDFLGGDKPSAADILLAVYSRWGASFPVHIRLGHNAQRMVEAILSMPSFQQAISEEKIQSGD
jgi:glutathione S-transferase